MPGRKGRDLPRLYLSSGETPVGDDPPPGPGTRAAESAATRRPVGCAHCSAFPVASGRTLSPLGEFLAGCSLFGLKKHLEIRAPTYAEQAALLVDELNHRFGHADADFRGAWPTFFVYRIAHY